MDRWQKTDRVTGQKVKSARYGTGLRWQARWVIDGKEYSKSYGRKVDAEQFLQTVVVESSTGTFVKPKDGRITVGEIWTDYISGQVHLKESTKYGFESVYRKHIQPTFGERAVSDVTPESIRSWVALLQSNGLQPATIRRAATVLRLLLKSAVERNALRVNPMASVKLPRVAHADRAYLTHSQVLALADSAPYSGTVIKFLAYTGLRFGEMAALRVRDFEMLRRKVNVSRAVTTVGGKLVWTTPKSHERRTVPFPESIADELSELMIGRSPDDLVFTTSTGKTWRADGFTKYVLKPALETVREDDPEFPTVVTHGLRHTFASLAVSSGASVKAVQRALGHAKASMTLDTYADLFDSDLDDVAVRMDGQIRAADQLRTTGTI